MNGLKRPVTVALVILLLVVAFVAGTMVASGSPATVPAAPAALTPGQQAALQTSNWLMTTGVEYVAFLPTVMRH